MAGGSSKLSLRAPLTGLIVPLDDVPDPVFSQRLVGDGISIEPFSQELVAPCDAQVVQVHRAAHAITLAASGIEIMLHIGLDTVQLKGQGFTARVKAGDEVRAGQPLISFDADYVATHARSLLTEMIITNGERVAKLVPRSGKVQAGRDIVLDVLIAGETAAAAAFRMEDAVESQPIKVAHAAGLHARPAALIAAAARGFAADIRLLKGEDLANARSVVSIMALEVAGGDVVRVVARGEDAARAVATIAELLVHDSDLPAAAPAATPRRAPTPAAREGWLQGVAAAPGVAVGTVYQLRFEDAVLPERAGDPQHERRELDTAISTAHLQLEALQERVAAEADDDRAGIFGAHQQLLDDPELLDAAAELIRNGASAAFAWRTAYEEQADRLMGLDNPLFAARASDIRDVGKRVLHLLVGHQEGPLDLPAGCIIITEDLSPSETATLDRTRVRGICTSMGSATSHVAILARALAIPAIAGIDPRALELESGQRVILDGDAGVLNPEPSAREEAEVAQQQTASAHRHAVDVEHAHAPAVTRDGVRIEIVGNLGAETEAAQLVAMGGEGVGLLRTEFLFMDRRSAPDEEEQARVYRNIAQVLGPDRILVIRALDVGGDKPLSYMPLGAEANPFLGERGIRLLLNRPEVLRTQIRAIVRAADAGKVAIMFPMIATIAEWRSARAMVEDECRALGVPRPQIGIMVETASAALLAERFAVDADFFSIGTNDLTQYTLAMDRTHPRLAPQVDALHPAVLRLIESTVNGARKYQRWVGVCGALASDPQAVPILLGLGVNELSVSVPAIPAIKARVRELSLAECSETARAALDAFDAAEVHALVAQRHGEL